MRRTVLAAFAAGAMLVGVAMPAQADTYGWRWPTTALTVYDGTHSKYTAAAIEAWDSATVLSFSRASASAADITINFGVTEQPAWDAQTDWTFVNGVPVKATIIINEKYAGSGFQNRQLRAQRMTFWVLHEIGHGFALAHTDSALLPIPSVMYAVPQAFYKVPQAYDIKTTNELYS